MIKLSDYIFSYLKNKGIKHAFMLPGGGAMHLVDSLGRSGIEYFSFLHEQGASIAAEAYAQHTNTPGLVVVTSGPGATNAITAVTAGWIDSSPMIIISGQAKRKDLIGSRNVRQIGSQEVQIIPMVKGITKYSVQVLEPKEIKYHLDKAYYEAVSGRPGPVWLDIPLDVQANMIDENDLIGYEHSNTDHNLEDIKKTAKKTIDLLKESDRPLLLIGNGVKISGGQEALKELVGKLKVPIVTTWKTVDMFDEEDEYYVGHPGIMGDRGANLIVQDCDLLISIGSRLDSSITAFNEEHFAYKSKKVVIDIDQNEISRMNMDIEVSCACDASIFIDELNSLTEDEVEYFETYKKETFLSWLENCKHLREKYPVITLEHQKEDKYVSSYWFIKILCDLLKADDVIVPESSGGAGEITYQAFKVKFGQKIKNAAGLGSMGFGLPYSIGACIANNRKRTVLINGDGAFQLNIQELQTLKHLDLPVKMFIWCNGGYASIRSMQRNNFEGNYVGSSIESGHSIPDLVKVAEAYGFDSYCIRNNNELEHLMPVIMGDNKPCLCTIYTNPNETVSPRVKAYVGENGEMKSGLLENMWPFI